MHYIHQNEIKWRTDDTHLKALYYEPWKAGTVPPGVVVIEFTLEDSWQSQVDIEAMMRNPKPWVERYLRNNWNLWISSSGFVLAFASADYVFLRARASEPVAAFIAAIFGLLYVFMARPVL